MVIKVTGYGANFHQATLKALRALREMRIRGVKTNTPFLENVLQHPTFLAGETHTRFIEETPKLFQFPLRRDRATKLLHYLGEVIVNGHPTLKVEQRLSPTDFREARLPNVPPEPPPPGTPRIVPAK